MTVDTVVKVVESEKCGLDMSSYADPHLSPPKTSAATNVGGDGNDDYVIVNDSDVASADDHAENHENENVDVAKLRVEGNDNDDLDVIGDAESDRFENGVTADVEEVTVVNEVNVREESEGGVDGGGLEEESREIELKSKVVVVENGGSDGNVSVTISKVSKGSDRDLVVDEVEEDNFTEAVVDEVKENNDLKPVVDEVKENNDLKPVVDEVKDNNDLKPAVDEANEGDISELVVDEVKENNDLKPVVDEVKESNNPKPCVDEVTEDGSVIETGNNGSASVDRNVSRPLDVDDNNENGVYGAHETGEVEAEDSTVANGVSDAPEPSKIEGDSGLDLVVDGVHESNDMKSVVAVDIEENESVTENGDNGNASIDSNGARSLDADHKNSAYDVKESAEVEADSTVVSSVPDSPEPSDVKEGSAVDTVVDKVMQSNDLKHVVDDEVTEDEPVLEIGDSGNVSVDSIGPRSLDVDGTFNNSVYDAQEPAEVEEEDKTSVISVPDAPELSEVKDVSVVDPVVDEVKVSAYPKPVVDEEVKEDESFLKTGDNGNASDDRNGYRSLDVGDNNRNSSFDAQESAEVEKEDSTVLNTVQDAHGPSESGAHISTAAVEVSQAELVAEQHIVLPPENRAEIQESEPERLEEDQAVSENNGDVHGVDTSITELNSAECLVMESKPLETDVSDHSVENGLKEAQSLDGHVKASLPVVAEDNGLPLDDAIPSEHLSDYHQQNLPPADRENEKGDSIEMEANTDKQGDVDPVANWEIQECQDSKTAGCELGPGEKGENPDLIGSNSSDEPEENLHNQTGVGQNQSNLEFAAPPKENPVSIIVGQPGESKIESAGVEENNGALAEMQFNITDKSVLEHELEKVDEEGESEVTSEIGGSLEASHAEGFFEDRVAEQTGSIDVLVKNISSEDCSTEQTLTLEDTTDLSKDSKLQSTDNTAKIADEDDQDSSHSRDDTNSKSKTDVPIKSNNVSDSTSTLEISFGSFGSVSPFSQNGIHFPSDALTKSIAVSNANGEGLLNSPENGDHSVELDRDKACAHVARPEQVNEVSASSVEGAEADSSDAQNINPDLVRRLFYWLIKVPRFDEGKFKDPLRQIEIELAEKTKTRDAFQVEFNKKQAYCRELKSTCEAVNSEVKAARELVWAKSREIESTHSLINLARHGITVADLDKKIRSLEHKLQHQTLNNLREEKELVREIKQLNIERQKLSANSQGQQEVQRARNERAQTEEQLTVLKKEIDGLRDNLSKVDERFRAAKKKHDEETVLLNDLRQQLKSADDIRQEAYAHLKTLKKQLNEKNAPFYKAKDDLRLAYNYAEAGKNDSLERHCVNQVETVMEIWNQNYKFRKEYIQCNMRRTVYKFGTLDGTCLGIDEVPPSLGKFSDNKVTVTAKVNSPTEVLTVKRDLPVQPNTVEDRKLKKVEQKKASPAKKIEAVSKGSLVETSSMIEIEEDKEEPPRLTKEEVELAKKVEQLRKEEEAVRLREQRRLEEKAKAEEALERKRRNALKAQARAEFKARKEAEEKEKEREKRAKKKGKKRGDNTANVPDQSSEPSSESVKEPEIMEKPTTKAKRPRKASLHLKQIKTTKPIPPALRNKGKRGLLRHWPYACIVLLAIALFYLGSFERIQAIQQHISALLHR